MDSEPQETARGRSPTFLQMKITNTADFIPLASVKLSGIKFLISLEK